MPDLRVAITDFIHPPLDIEQQVLGNLASVSALQVESEAELHGRIEDADALMVYHFAKLGRDTIASLRRCKVIVRCGAGYDNVDWRAAGERGIPVTNVPDYGVEEVADSAIALTLALVRGVHYLNVRGQASTANWSYEQIAPTYRLRGRRFALLGLGRIGGATALRAKAFGMRPVFFDPYVVDGVDKALAIDRVDTVEELLDIADILSVHCPRTPETQHLVNDAALARMKPGGYLVNTARGGVVDAAAVLRALASGHLRGAGLDVLEVEPPAPDDPLIQAWRDPAHPAYGRLILNPHSAFYSEEGLQDMRRKGSENCRRAFLGQPLRNVVNADALSQSANSRR